MGLGIRDDWAPACPSSARTLARLGVAGKGFVVDTARNGNGAMDAVGQHVNWCNPAGRRLGIPSSIGVAGADYLLWIKYPGDSDGSCGIGQGIPAGTLPSGSSTEPDRLCRSP
ncbi:glycoside hydrolase family 6 protein [Streptomyces olindensis]|uniref:Glucanase n=1 Tax=Streptomyces olindensis TaxID=358823 RepID=A0ABV2XNZ0_9ACTN